VKCSGVEICRSACINACPQKAITVNEPEKALGSDELIQKVTINRELCNGCMKCAQVCVPGSLYVSGYDITVDEVYARLEKDRMFFRKGGGITISGGEPMAQFDFTHNLVKRLKEGQFHICLDTTGYAKTEQYEAILPYIDLFLYDIKEMDPKIHKKLTGVDNALIHENARCIAEHGGALQIRIPVIPKLNDKEANLHLAAEFIASLGDAVKLVQLLPYHATGRAKYSLLGWKYRLEKVSAPTEERMEELLEMFKEYGLNCQIH
jgi:pyruvate formate lyase activating enzyme